MKKTISILLSLFVGLNVMAYDLPQLVKNNHGVKQLIVNEKPYVMLAGEVMNSSASTLESIDLFGK